METKLSYLCICPWAKLPEFFSELGGFVPSQIFPTRDGRSAVVEFAPSVNDVVELVKVVESYIENFMCDGKKDN